MVAATVYSDGAGNKYLGDCLWHNPDISYPLDYFLDTFTFDDNNAPERVFDYHDSLNALFAEMGATNADLGPLGVWNTGGTYLDVTLPSYIRLRFDTSASSTISFTDTIPGASISRNDLGLAADSNIGLDEYTLFSNAKHESIVVSGSSNHLAFLVAQYDKDSDSYQYVFRYGGKLQNVNTNFSYYNRNNLTQGVVGGCNQHSVFGFKNLLLKHYTDSGLAQLNKTVLTSGDADYPFVCADAQVPTADWATDFYVFDNNPDLGNPCMGKLPGLLIAQGTYEIMKPVKITSAATADGGSPWFLPVASYHGFTKTVLMRVHSSMV